VDARNTTQFVAKYGHQWVLAAARAARRETCKFTPELFEPLLHLEAWQRQAGQTASYTGILDHAKGGEMAI
jgi:hypothetical protein